MTEQTDAAEKKIPDRYSRRDRIFLVLSFLLPFLLLMTVRICMLRDGEAAYDAFYHSKMAKLGPSVILGKEFPWLDMSIWKTAFADKEMLYHLSMWAIFRVQSFFGFEPAPPFHFAAGFYLILLCASYVYAGMRFRVPPALLCIGSLLFTLISPNWAFREVMLRPHIVSIACLLTACGILARGSLKFRLTAIGILSFFYSWTYSNPHFIVLPPLVFALSALLLEGKWKELSLPLLSLASVVAALVIHPQFPASFTIWKVQSWDALIAPMMGFHEITKPVEMTSPTFVWCLTVIPLFLLVYITVFYTVRLMEKTGWRGLGPEIPALALLAWIFSFGIFLAMRSIEYSAPLSVLLFLILLDRADREKMLNPFRRFGHGVQLAVLAVLAAAVASFSMVKALLDGPKAVNHVPVNTAKWMKEHLRPGEAVVNLDWSDFPILFHADSDHRYQWGMDPVFSLACDSGKTRMLNATRIQNTKPPSWREVNRAFNCRYAVVLYPRIQHASLLSKNGWRLKEEIRSPDGKRTEGWIFALDSREALHLPEVWIQPQPQKKKGK